MAMSLGFCVPTTAAGQEFRGTVVGRVTDPTGSLVPEARVRLIELDTSASLGTVTNGEGFYILQYIPPGRYRLRIDTAGFQSMTLEQIDT
jgi:Carboxypeptidase regulatory-like domain